jgi:hypothetical protein
MFYLSIPLSRDVWVASYFAFSCSLASLDIPPLCAFIEPWNVSILLLTRLNYRIAYLLVFSKYKLCLDKVFVYLLHSQLLAYHLVPGGSLGKDRLFCTILNIHLICFGAHSLTMNDVVALSMCFLEIFPLRDFCNNSIFSTFISFLECQETFWGPFVPIFKGYV